MFKEKKKPRYITRIRVVVSAPCLNRSTRFYRTGRGTPQLWRVRFFHFRRLFRALLQRTLQLGVPDPVGLGFFFHPVQILDQMLVVLDHPDVLRFPRPDRRHALRQVRQTTLVKLPLSQRFRVDALRQIIFVSELTLEQILCTIRETRAHILLPNYLNRRRPRCTSADCWTEDLISPRSGLKNIFRTD